MKLEELEIYKLSLNIGEKVWDIVMKWDNFSKETIGKQLIRAVDSVSANLSEGYGRFHFKDTNRFNYFSRGSLYETKTWLTKAYQRQLITEEEFKYFEEEIKNLSVKLNNYIAAIGRHSKNYKK